jgi:hypothetical protein
VRGEPVLTDLERLAELRDKGILTEEEFQEQKRHYLAAPLALRHAVPAEQRVNNAFLIEAVGGFLGFLGLGYIYAGRTEDGLVRLVGWWIAMAAMWTAVGLLTAVLIGVCLWLPAVAVQLGVPLWSASQLKLAMEAEAPPAS